MSVLPRRTFIDDIDVPAQFFGSGRSAGGRARGHTFFRNIAETRYNEDVPHSGFPGADLIEAGLRDLSDGVESVSALLVSIGAPRLRRLGVVVPHPLSSPERRLYALLQQQHGDAAHARYNALIRRLVSYERAAECAR